MFDEMDRLRDSAPLRELLGHYASLAAPDRQAWQDRHSSGDRREVTRLHGELIAFGWVEQNTGFMPGGYRVTSAGLRALKQV